MVAHLACRWPYPGRLQPRATSSAALPTPAFSPPPSGPLPVYGASKSYVDSLSRSIHAEAAPGVRVQNIWPMFVCELGSA